MAGAGVGTLPVLISSTHLVDTHQLTSTLQRAGVSYQGAQAFALGNPVPSVSDRKALASLFADALRQLASG